VISEKNAKDTIDIPVEIREALDRRNSLLFLWEEQFAVNKSNIIMKRQLGSLEHANKRLCFKNLFKRKIKNSIMTMMTRIQ